MDNDFDTKLIEREFNLIANMLNNKDDLEFILESANPKEFNSHSITSLIFSKFTSYGYGYFFKFIWILNLIGKIVFLSNHLKDTFIVQKKSF